LHIYIHYTYIEMIWKIDEGSEKKRKSKMEKRKKGGGSE
jgi:hypothetical protein